MIRINRARALGQSENSATRASSMKGYSAILTTINILGRAVAFALAVVIAIAWESLLAGALAVNLIFLFVKCSLSYRR